MFFTIISYVCIPIDCQEFLEIHHQFYEKIYILKSILSLCIFLSYFLFCKILQNLNCQLIKKLHTCRRQELYNVHVFNLMVLLRFKSVIFVNATNYYYRQKFKCILCESDSCQSRSKMNFLWPWPLFFTFTPELFFCIFKRDNLNLV